MGAAGEDGFPGAAGGYGGRQNLLLYGDGVAFEVSGTDTGASVRVTYDVTAVPDVRPAMGHLADLVDGATTDAQRVVFDEAWHGRIESVLTGDDDFAIESVDASERAPRSCFVIRYGRGVETLSPIVRVRGRIPLDRHIAQ